MQNFGPFHVVGACWGGGLLQEFRGEVIHPLVPVALGGSEAGLPCGQTAPGYCEAPGCGRPDQLPPPPRGGKTGERVGGHRLISFSRGEVHQPGKKTGKAPEQTPVLIAHACGFYGCIFGTHVRHTFNRVLHKMIDVHSL